MERIKFYSVSDFSAGSNLKKIVELLTNFNCNKNEFDINDIIEFHNIIKFRENGLLEEYCKQHNVKNFGEIINLFRKIIGQFISKEKANFIRLIKSVEIMYIEDFWELIEYYKIYENISIDDFSKFIQSSEFHLQPILKNKKTVSHFGDLIRDYMISDSSSAELLLSEYEIDHLSSKRDAIFFPPTLTLNDKEKIIRDYVSSDYSNFNYLRIIVDLQNTSELRVSDKIRLEASKRIKIEEEKIFETNSGLKFSTLVSFNKDQEDEVIYSHDGTKCECKVSLKWINENLDYPTLLNNFIYLFEFVDSQMRLTLVSKLNDLGIMERHFIMRSKKSYKIGVAFQQKDFLSKLQMYGYYEHLSQLNIRLESIIEWFFSEYLSDEFGINNFRVKMPSEDSSYLEKCRSILPELDSVLKQYRLFIDDGKIDHELLQMSSGHLFFRDCISIIEKKYIYANSQIYNTASFYFFSDQCMLSYVPRLEDKYTNFFDLITKERVSLSDFEEYQKRDLEWLIKNEFIELDDKGLLNIKNLTRVLIFKDLYQNEVISYYRVPERYKKEIDLLLKKEILKFEDKFFSIPEYEYFDYHLNKATFNNALDLRNIYLHGTQPSENDKIHKEHYMMFLRLFIILIIKINDDLSIWEIQKMPINKGNKE